LQLFIISSISIAIFIDTGYKLWADQEFSYLAMKIVCSAALHIMICPEVAGTMDIFKYTINQCHLFSDDSEVLVQLMAFISLVINIVAEFLNIYMLTYQHNIVFVLMEVVCLEIIIELPSIYMSSLVQDKLRDRIFAHHHLAVEKKGSEIKWKDRSLTNKMFRFLYRVIRGVYCSVIFYFQPFFTLYIY